MEDVVAGECIRVQKVVRIAHPVEECLIRGWKPDLEVPREWLPPPAAEVFR